MPSTQKNQTETQSDCPVCGSANTLPFFEISQVPVECNVLWNSRAGAVGIARGDLALSFCRACGHIFNTRFDPDLLAYSNTYENSLHFSARFQEYAHDLAQGLVQRHALRGKQIVEIGSGKGDFLNMLCELGDNQGVGFDPSYDGQDSPFERIQFVQSYFNEEHIVEEADLICSRHTLEHIPHPAGFARMLRRAARQGDTTVFLEVPNARYTLDELAIWDLIYEHCSYFSAPSLARLLTTAGFDVCRIEETYGGQFLTIEASPAVSSPGAVLTELSIPAPASIEKSATGFASRFTKKMHIWQARLADLRASGKKAVLWGAGSKGISFLNFLKVGDEIEYVVDINPRKRGRFISGAGQQIVPPEFLKEYQPDVVIIMNPIYNDEIRQTLADLNLQSQLLNA